VNPIVSTTIKTAGKGKSSLAGTPITHPETMLWAHLFNLRYRSLLVTLLRTFEYPSNLSETSSLTPRGLLIHATFGEMYNLRALAQILMELPLEKGSNLAAGPPFQMPYTLRLPVDPVDRLHLHLDLLDASERLTKRLSGGASGKYDSYLQALQTADSHIKGMIETMLRGTDRIG
jgi:hypothetical protein